MKLLSLVVENWWFENLLQFCLGKASLVAMERPLRLKFMAVWVELSDSVLTADKQDRELDGHNQVF